MGKEFFDTMAGSFLDDENGISEFLGGQSVNSDYFSSVAKVSSKKTATAFLSGTRVAFVYNASSVLSYKNVPNEGVIGTVVLVKTARGNTTGDNLNAYVRWDDGNFGLFRKPHLKLAGVIKKRANTHRMTVANLGSVANIFVSGREGNNELIHKATKDLWSLSKTKDGSFVIERLFNESGDPIKV